MTRWLTILLLGLMTVGALETKASMAIGSQRFDLRWNGVNRGLPLPFAGRSNPLIPVGPWVPTNSITFTTNRVMLPHTLNVLFLGNNLVGDDDLHYHFKCSITFRQPTAHPSIPSPQGSRFPRPS